MNRNQITCYKMTFETIQAVRVELAKTTPNDTIKIALLLDRLACLYASIDAKRFVECMGEVETMGNVVFVDFKKGA